MPNYQGVWDITTQFQYAAEWPVPHPQDIGLFAGGITVANIDFVSISTTGNAEDFGDLTVARYYVSGLGSSTRGVFGAGDGAKDGYRLCNCFVYW